MTGIRMPFNKKILLFLLLVLPGTFSFGQIPGVPDSGGNPSPVPSSSGSAYVSLFAFFGNKLLEGTRKLLQFSELEVKPTQDGDKKVYEVNVANKNNTIKFSKKYNMSKSNF